MRTIIKQLLLLTFIALLGCSSMPQTIKANTNTEPFNRKFVIKLEFPQINYLKYEEIDDLGLVLLFVTPSFPDKKDKAQIIRYFISYEDGSYNFEENKAPFNPSKEPWSKLISTTPIFSTRDDDLNFNNVLSSGKPGILRFVKTEQFCPCHSRFKIQIIYNDGCQWEDKNDFLLGKLYPIFSDINKDGIKDIVIFCKAHTVQSFLIYEGNNTEPAD